MIDDTAASRKQALREQARKARIAQPNKEAVSAEVCRAIVAMPEYAAAKTVLWYVDAGSEVKTRHALPEALTQGKTIVVPYCIVETNQLELFHLEAMEELVEGAYKILEPDVALRDKPGKRIEPELLDFVLVPGTAFSPDGARMGQGKGYYDRLLNRVRRDAPLVGVAFDGQIFDDIPMDVHDVFMDYIATPTRLLKGKGRG